MKEFLEVKGYNFFIIFRLQCLVSLFKQTAENILLLTRKETWQIEYLEEGGITKLVLIKLSFELSLQAIVNPLYLIQFLLTLKIRLGLKIRSTNLLINYFKPSQFEDMVMEVAQLVKDTVLACGPRETPLLKGPDQKSLYHQAIKSLFGAFSRCLQQLAFSGSDDTFDDEITTVSQLTGSPAAYRIRDSKLHGPVSKTLEFLIIFLDWIKILHRQRKLLHKLY